MEFDIAWLSWISFFGWMHVRSFTVFSTTLATNISVDRLSVVVVAVLAVVVIDEGVVVVGLLISYESSVSSLEIPISFVTEN